MMRSYPFLRLCRLCICILLVCQLFAPANILLTGQALAADKSSRLESVIYPKTFDTGNPSCFTGTTISPGTSKIYPVQISTNGTLFINIYSKEQSINAAIFYDAACTSNAGASAVVAGTTTGNDKYSYLRINNAVKRTYYLKLTNTGTEKNANAGWYTKFATCNYQTTTADNQFFAGTNGGTKKDYVKFKLKKRAMIRTDTSSAYYELVRNQGSDPYKTLIQVQRYSNKKWKTVSRTMTGYDNGNEQVIQLSSGTHRFVLSSSSPLLRGSYWIDADNYNEKYKTKKSKAISIGQGYSAIQIITASNTTSHWYKVKLKKKRKFKFEFYVLTTNGGLKCKLYTKKGKKVSYSNTYKKSDYSSTEIHGKTKSLKAGTYYIKIYKASKGSSGEYTFFWK